MELDCTKKELAERFSDDRTSLTDFSVEMRLHYCICGEPTLKALIDAWCKMDIIYKLRRFP